VDPTAHGPATGLKSADTVLDSAVAGVLLDVKLGGLHRLRAGPTAALARSSGGRGPMWPTAPPAAGSVVAPAKASAARVCEVGRGAVLAASQPCLARFLFQHTPKPSAPAPARYGVVRSGSPWLKTPTASRPLPRWAGSVRGGGEALYGASAQPLLSCRCEFTAPVIFFSRSSGTPWCPTGSDRERWPWH